jgi:manganese transport protein
MEGYLRLRINPLLRRLLTRLVAIIPAVLVIVIYGDEELDELLVLSQVILSLQLGFAIIPLIHFVSDRETMGDFVIKPWVKILSWLVAGILVFLNVQLVAEGAISVFAEEGNVFLKILIAIASLAFSWLFFMMTLLPVFRKRKEKASIRMHSEEKLLKDLSIPATHTIAVALDFTDKDERIIAYALAQGKKETSYVLLHIVETVAAKYSGEASDDYETRKDEERLEAYALQLRDMGYAVKIDLGYKNRITEIVRIVTKVKADILVMGAHRHSGLKDFLYGETVNQVRHKLSIPVLIVNE